MTESGDGGRQTALSFNHGPNHCQHTDQGQGQGQDQQLLIMALDLER